MYNMSKSIDIEKRGDQIAVIDGNGATLALFNRLYDASICLRFITGKYLPRSECEYAEKLLQAQTATDD